MSRCHNVLKIKKISCRQYRGCMYNNGRITDILYADSEMEVIMLFDEMCGCRQFAIEFEND